MVDLTVTLTSGESKRVLILDPDRFVESLEEEVLDGQEITVMTMASGRRYFITHPSAGALIRMIRQSHVDPRLDDGISH